MVTRDIRPSVRLGDWEPPQQYNQPILEPDGDIREVEHKVLSDKSVIQKTGENAETFTLRGDAYAEDLKQLREMKGERVTIRHTVHSGPVMVRRVSGTSTGSWDEYTEEDEDFPVASVTPSNDIVRWVYNYTIELVSIE